MPATLWERTTRSGKIGFDKLYTWVDMLGAPVNKLTNKLGSEAFWPTTLDKESDKAARILRSFCKDGFYADEERAVPDGPTAKQRVVKKIPAAVIQNAKGLAIFTTMRTGLWISGAGGSGVLVGRKADGTWSPPSGILLHTAGLGFLVGVDIYDCVVVINTQKALDAFSKLRCTLGGEVSAVAGPVGAGGILETELHKRQAPVFTYLKSRGFYAGVQVDGTIIVERMDENERFYGQRISVADILAGKVRHPPYETRKLLETIKAAQGDADVDESIVPSEPPPGDFEIDDSGHQFGVPDKDDPDPYGVLSLEKEGLVIREAGTQNRASWEQFTFAPSPTSPLYNTFDRKAKDKDSRSGKSEGQRKSWMTGTTAVPAESTTSRMVETSTQTDFPDEPSSPNRSVHSSTLSGSQRASMTLTEQNIEPPSPGPYSPSFSRNSYTNGRRSQLSHSTSPRRASPPLRDSLILSDSNNADEDSAGEEDHDDYDAAIEEPVVVHSIQKAPAPQIINRARLVTVPKRTPPILPPRNPSRRGPLVINADGGSDAGSPVFPSSPSALPSSPVGLSPPSSTRVPSTSPPRVAHLLGGAHADDAQVNQLDDVNLASDDDEDEDEAVTSRDPWAKARERRSLSRSASPASLEAPGAFHSLPTTPDAAELHKE